MKVVVAVWMLFGFLGIAVAAPGTNMVGTVVSHSWETCMTIKGRTFSSARVQQKIIEDV